jgi:hypothetical protein
MGSGAVGQGGSRKPVPSVELLLPRRPAAPLPIFDRIHVR